MNSIQDDDILDISKISLEEDFEYQVKEVLSQVRLNRREVENLQCLLDDLENTFGYCWPGVQVHPFGSIVTGLGIKSSDIDCYVELPPNSQVNNPVKWARDLLKREYQKFSQLLAITTAKVPIVKFFHNPTGFNCDVNFSSSNGVRNSKLIACLLKMDPRVLSLAILIKCWAKRLGLTGTNLLANYALTMMVIFYLQIVSVLPSVEELQRDTECYLVDNWNTAFNDFYAYVSDNSDSLYMLLGGFFKFYSSFDFAHNMISPYLGRPVKKEAMQNVHSSALPTSYRLYKQNVLCKKCDVIKLDTVMCVQDPFQHSRNCTVAVYVKLFHKIQGYVELASKMFEEHPSKRFLKELLTMSVPIGVPQKGPKKKAKLKKKIKYTSYKHRNERIKAYRMHFERHKFGNQLKDNNAPWFR